MSACTHITDLPLEILLIIVNFLPIDRIILFALITRIVMPTPREWYITHAPHYDFSHERCVWYTNLACNNVHLHVDKWSDTSTYIEIEYRRFIKISNNKHIEWYIELQLPLPAGTKYGAPIISLIDLACMFEYCLRTHRGGRLRRRLCRAIKSPFIFVEIEVRSHIGTYSTTDPFIQWYIDFTSAKPKEKWHGAIEDATPEMVKILRKLRRTLELPASSPLFCSV